jgi:uncharacterized cupredoxin-like copper-binding protein
MRLRVLLLGGFVLAVAVGCSAGSAGAPATPLPSAQSLGTDTRFEVELTDALKIEPVTLTVPANVSVTFVVTNTGATDHEFYLGDEAAQAEHEQEMAGMRGMMHDEPEGMAVAPGETKQLTYMFTKPGMTLAGCHVSGH